MRIVTDESEIFEFEIMDIAHGGIQFHAGKRSRRAAQLFACLFEMVSIKMQIAKSVDEFTGLQAADLRYHHGEERVTRDVERHAQKKIGATLVKLTTERAVLDMKLKKRVTGW